MTQFRDVVDHKNISTALTILVLFNEDLLNVKAVMKDKTTSFSLYIQRLFRNHLTVYCHEPDDIDDYKCYFWKSRK